MPNIITDIQVSGVTYTLSAETSGGTVDPSLDSGSTNAVANSAITEAVEASGLTVTGIPIGYEVTYPNGMINKFIMYCYVTGYSGARTERFYYSDGTNSLQGSVRLRYRLDGTISEILSTSGDFTATLANGEIVIELNEGYYFKAMYSSSTYIAFKYNKEYSGGTASEVIEGSVAQAISDVQSKVPAKMVTDVTPVINATSKGLDVQVKYSTNTTSVKTIQPFYDDKTIKYNSGFYVNFKGKELHTVILNDKGAWNFCSVPEDSPSYDDAFDYMTINFNSGYTGSNQTSKIDVYTIDSGGTTARDVYTYDMTSNTIAYTSGDGITRYDYNDYVFLVRPKLQYRNMKVCYIAEYYCNIADISNSNQNNYIITGVTAPTYNYNGQDVIDDIYDKLASGSSITVSSAITSGDTNPVEGGVLYDELRINNTSEITLEWENNDEGYTTNYPSGSGCSKLTIYTDINYGGNGYYFRNSVGEDIGYIFTDIENDTLYVTDYSGCTYTMSGNVITVEYPSIAADVDYIYSSYDNYWTIKTIIEGTPTRVIDQVTANTVSLSGKQDTLSAGTGISISGNVISATGGGGKSIEAGRGISITTGATADTISFSLPISADTNNNFIYGSTTNTVDNNSVVNYNTLIGTGNTITHTGSLVPKMYENIIYGERNTISFKGASATEIANNLILGFNNNIGGDYGYYRGYGRYNIVCGYSNGLNKSDCSFVHGWVNSSNGNYQFLNGCYLQANNNYEATFGQYNVSNSATTTFGNSGNTLFSVGNGTSASARHNAFEIRQNGDIYITINGQDVKLQDILLQLSGTTS